jgi:predicted GIY-YIG superfamily endonuclease
MNICGYIFSGPYNPDDRFSVSISAVYVIYDGNKVLDIGQTDDLNDRLSNHERKDCWERNKTGRIDLYFLPESDQQKRLFIEKYIRTVLNPVCGSF